MELSTDEAFGTGPGIARSEAIDLPEGPTVFLAKTFRIDGDLGIASGAVAAGRCARDQRLVTIMFAIDGRLDFDRPGGPAPDAIYAEPHRAPGDTRLLRTQSPTSPR